MAAQNTVEAVSADGILRQEKIVCGNAFSNALCAHFGLPASRVDGVMQVHAGSDEIFGVTLRICLTAEDLAGIAKHMGTSG